jgi:hypothetical protein
LQLDCCVISPMDLSALVVPVDLSIEINES